MEDDSIFRNRIFIDEKLLKRLSKRAVTLLSSLESLPEAQRLDQVHLLLAELNTYELQVKKVERMIKVNQNDIETYRSRSAQIELEIKSCQEIVKILENSLEEAIMLKKNKEEYDSVAEHILKLPSREELENEIRTFQSDTESLVAQQDQIESLMVHHRGLITGTFSQLSCQIEAINDDLKNLSNK